MHAGPLLQAVLSIAFVLSYIILTIALRDREYFPLHLLDENSVHAQVTGDSHTGRVAAQSILSPTAIYILNLLQLLHESHALAGEKAIN